MITFIERFDMRSSYENVKEWRRNTKLRLIEAFGGECAICRYSKSKEVFDFHHLDPGDKESLITAKCMSWVRVVAEVRKCVMLCANCHREVHAGVAIVPEDAPRFDESFLDYRYSKYCDDCPICGERKPVSQKTCSRSCGARVRYKVEWNKYDLASLYEELGSFVGVARFIGGVSDNAVRKRMKKIGIL